MDAKLKSLKVTDLRDILAKASAPAPTKTNKHDLIHRILANPTAVQVYHQLYPSPEPKNIPLSTAPINSCSNDDLLAPPEDLDLDEFNDPPPVSSPSLRSSSLKQSPSQPQVTPPPKAVVLVTPAADKQARVDQELEKRKARAARFGIPLVEPKKLYSPQPKKGSPENKPTPLAEEPERLNARSARFGGGDASNQPPKKGRKRVAPVEVDPEELERRRKRAERFGQGNREVAT
ncbi:hypothetical protein PAXRUDRAFT_830205 [Paxillus rubicundulus Ve08.2h10]|uniref:THO1-MOS11 C-terminal domain-containing protein n=1 Tax=Paxillus rubicundulus Ve08.2h10 TaxID=930991 RepID=A0A0D0DTU9_9AGAM|nr:hypothetical protein PAXRUDRAFT_830205 [Paxillus rubicundulus Ve08.2h10]